MAIVDLFSQPLKYFFIEFKNEETKVAGMEGDIWTQQHSFPLTKTDLAGFLLCVYLPVTEINIEPSIQSHSTE